jgi:hypothetical protein
VQIGPGRKEALFGPEVTLIHLAKLFDVIIEGSEKSISSPVGSVFHEPHDSSYTYPIHTGDLPFIIGFTADKNFSTLQPVSTAIRSPNI